MAKIRISITVSRDLIDWMDKMIERKPFASRSHGVELALTRLKDSTKG